MRIAIITTELVISIPIVKFNDIGGMATLICEALSVRSLRNPNP